MDLIGVRFLLAQRKIHRETETTAGGISDAFGFQFLCGRD